MIEVAAVDPQQVVRDHADRCHKHQIEEQLEPGGVAAFLVK